MHRRKLVLLPVLLMIFLLSACTAGTETVMERESDCALEMTCSRMNETRSYTLSLTRPTAIAVSATTEAGTLHLEIAQSGETPIYTGNLTESVSFTVNAQPGTYCVTVEGRNHTGGLRLDWAEEKAE